MGNGWWGEREEFFNGLHLLIARNIVHGVIHQIIDLPSIISPINQIMNHYTQVSIICGYLCQTVRRSTIPCTFLNHDF